MKNTTLIKKINKLSFYDTPTICNGLEIIDNSFKLSGYTKQKFFCLYPKMKPIVGFAKTAKISSVKNKRKKIKDMRIEYYQYVNQSNQPKISIINDVCNNPIGSFWGEVNSNIHLSLGCSGVITNGSVRDLDVVPKKFQMLSKTLSPSHAEVMLLDFGNKINIMGMEVNDGDLIHADVHGAVNIPLKYIDELFSAIDHISKKEKIIIDSVKKKPFKFSHFKRQYLKANKL